MSDHDPGRRHRERALQLRPAARHAAPAPPASRSGSGRALSPAASAVPCSAGNRPTASARASSARRGRSPGGGHQAVEVAIPARSGRPGSATAGRYPGRSCGRCSSPAPAAPAAPRSGPGRCARPSSGGAKAAAQRRGSRARARAPNCAWRGRSSSATPPELRARAFLSSSPLGRSGGQKARDPGGHPGSRGSRSAECATPAARPAPDAASGSARRPRYQAQRVAAARKPCIQADVVGLHRSRARRVRCVAQNGARSRGAVPSRPDVEIPTSGGSRRSRPSLVVPFDQLRQHRDAHTSPRSACHRWAVRKPLCAMASAAPGAWHRVERRGGCTSLRAELHCVLTPAALIAALRRRSWRRRSGAGGDSCRRQESPAAARTRPRAQSRCHHHLAQSTWPITRASGELAGVDRGEHGSSPCAGRELEAHHRRRAVLKQASSRPSTLTRQAMGVAHWFLRRGVGHRQTISASTTASQPPSSPPPLASSVSLTSTFAHVRMSSGRSLLQGKIFHATVSVTAR